MKIFVGKKKSISKSKQKKSKSSEISMLIKQYKFSIWKSKEAISIWNWNFCILAFLSDAPLVSEERR